MKHKLLVLAMAATLTGFAAAPAIAGPDVGVSIGINQPGVYGRINIGSYPQPALVYPQPVVVVPAPVVVERQPIYLYVPPTHQQNWRRYCGQYSACGQPVYFVQERWVRERYEEEHRDWQREHGQRGFKEHSDRGRHEGHERREERDDDRGKHGDRGEGHGKHGGEGRGNGR